MASLPLTSPSPLPAELAALSKLLAFTQGLGSERPLHRHKRGRNCPKVGKLAPTHDAQRSAIPP